MKAIIYSRVSTDNQDYERQIQDVTSYASKNNYEIIHHFEEKESGKVKKRKALSEMFQYVSENIVDAVIISELSRLGRTSEVLNTIEFLNEIKVNLISLKENLCTLNPDKTLNTTSHLILGIMASINSHELETMKYRIKSGLLSAAKRGHISGAALPYGYTSINKVLTIKSEEAQIVQEIFQLYLKNNGCSRICSILNYRGVKSQSGKRWQDAVVNRILHNPIYKGVRLYKGKELEAPAIVSKEEFDKVQEMFENHEMRQGIHKKYDYLFDNKKIRCGICGKSYFAHKRANGQDNAYKCISTRYKDSCGNWGINIDKLNRTVQEMIFKMAPTLLFEAFDMQTVKSKIEDIDQLCKISESELAKVKRKESNLVDLYVDGSIDKEMYDLKREDYKKQVSKFTKELNEFQGQKAELEKVMNESLEMLMDLKLWQEKGISKELLNKIITKIEVTKAPLMDIGSTFKNDKVIEVTIFTGAMEITYYISRYSDIVYVKSDND